MEHIVDEMIDDITSSMNSISHKEPEEEWEYMMNLIDELYESPAIKNKDEMIQLLTKTHYTIQRYYDSFAVKLNMSHSQEAIIFKNMYNFLRLWESFYQNQNDELCKNVIQTALDTFESIRKLIVDEKYKITHNNNTQNNTQNNETKRKIQLKLNPDVTIRVIPNMDDITKQMEDTSLDL